MLVSLPISSASLEAETPAFAIWTHSVYALTNLAQQATGLWFTGSECLWTSRCDPFKISVLWGEKCWFFVSSTFCSVFVLISTVPQNKIFVEHSVDELQVYFNQENLFTPHKSCSSLTKASITVRNVEKKKSKLVCIFVSGSFHHICGPCIWGAVLICQKYRCGMEYHNIYWIHQTWTCWCCRSETCGGQTNVLGHQRGMCCFGSIFSIARLPSVNLRFFWFCPIWFIVFQRKGL